MRGVLFSNLTNVAGVKIYFTATWKQTESPIIVDEIPEHVSVMVLLGDEQVRKEATGWFVPANTNTTVIFAALDDYPFDVEPDSAYATVEVAVGETAPETIACPKFLTPAPSVGGSLAWQSDTSVLLSMTVTNGTASAITDLVFVFEDRNDGSKIIDLSGDQLPEWGKKASWFSKGVSNTWRKQTIPATSSAFATVTNGLTGRVIVLFDLKEAGITKEDAENYLGWIGLRAYGRWVYAPVSKAAPAIAAYMPEFLALVSVGDINAILDYAACMANLEFTHFKIVDGKIAGVVRVSDEDGEEVSLSGTIPTKLHGTDDLKKAFEPCGTLNLTDGAFTVPIPTGKSFFKLSLESPSVR